MRKMISIAVLCLLVLSGVLFIPELGPNSMNASAKTITVNDNGGADYNNIQAAIDNASAGDTIHIWAGVYYEQLTINKAVSLIGNGSTVTKINGTGVGNVIYITSNWVNISGLNITGSGYSGNDAGINFYYADNCMIEYCNFSNNYAGIHAYHSNGLIIENNNCSNNYYGIWIEQYCDFNIIRNNICRSNQNYGIYFYYYCDDNVIEFNSCEKNNYGMYLYQYNYRTKIRNNTFDNNNNRGLYFYRGFDSIFENNTFNNNPSYGAYIRYCNNNIFKNNNFSNYNNGIYLNYCDSNVLDNNLINSTWGYGIYLSNSRNDVLTNNTMIKSGVHIYGTSLFYWNTHTIDTTNILNGKPVYYYKDLINQTVSPNAGQVILANCYNVTVGKVAIDNAYTGLLLGYSSKCVIIKNMFTNNYYGIYIARYCSDNILEYNNCSNNLFGIYFDYDMSNHIMRNNVFYSNSNYAIYMYYETYCTIENNLFVLNYMGIYMNWYANYNRISNNSFLMNSYGIYIYYCTGNIIENNTCNSNYYYGIYSYQSWENEILNNEVNDNSYGIYLEYLSERNLIKNNTANSNNNYGIYVYRSDNNTIENNNCSSNSFGIILNYLSSWSVVRNNTCNDNSNYGIYAYYANNTIYENNSFNNSYRSIFIEQYCFNSVIENNYGISNTGFGIYGYNSHNLTIRNNNFSSNAYGLYLEVGCIDTLVIDNTFASNSYHGICIIRSDNITIENNNCSFNKNSGVRIYQSDNVTLTNNLCNYNSEFGIIIDTSNRNMITNNDCNRNSIYGIYLYDSDHNYIDETNCEYNSDVGLNLYFSENNRITNSSFGYNTNYGTWLRESSNNTFYKDTLSYNDFGLMVEQNSNYNVFEQLTGSWNIDYCIYVDSSTNMKIIDNDFSYGKNPLIYLDRATDNEVSKNTLNNDNSACIWVEAGSGHKITENTVKTTGVKDHGIVLVINAHNCTVTKNDIDVADDYSYGFYLESVRDCVLEDNTIKTSGDQSFGIWALKCERITYKKNIINVYGRESAGMKLDDSINDQIFSSKINTWGQLSPGATFINSMVTIKDSTLLSATNVSFNLSAGADVVAINVKYNSGNVLHNFLSKLTIKNYLTISVNYTDGEPVSNVDVNVTNDGKPIYRSPGYSGSNPKTGASGMTPNLIVTSHQYINSLVPKFFITDIYLKKSIQGRNWSDSRNNIDMTASHTEFFTPDIDIMEPMANIIFISTFPDGQGLHLEFMWVKDAARYQLFMNGTADPKGSYYKVKELVGRDNNATDVTGLVDGVTYTFKLKVQDESGLWSAFSAEVSGIPIDTQPPAVPSGLKIDEVTAKNVSLSWTKNSEHDLDGYKIYRKSITGVKSIGTTKNNWFLDTDVEEGLYYSYAISAYDEVPNYSPMTAFIGPVEIPILPPMIISHEPEKDAVNIPVDTKIRIMFSKSMITKSVISAFKITPSVDGKFSFSNQDINITFSPAQPLMYSTEYTITINTTASDKKFNRHLVEDYTWSFTTEPDIYPPEILKFSPTGDKVKVNSDIRITFSEKMNIGTVFDSFTITPKVNVTMFVEDNTIIFKPNGLLDYNTTYEVKIGTTAKDLAGNGLPAVHSWSFKTLTLEDSAPLVVEYSPKGINVPLDSEIFVLFNKPMAPTTVQNAFKLTPGVNGGKFMWDGNKLIFQHSANFKLNKTYYITITSSAKDINGNNLVDDLNWNFTTGFELGTSPATIIKLVPEPDAEAEINTNVELGFSKDIISQRAKLILKSSNGTPINGIVKYSDTSHVMTFTLTDNKYFDYNTIYHVELSGITVDKGEFNINVGNQTYSWSFTTKAITEADSDGDGLNDKWELDNGLDPFDGTDAKKDPDKDGLNNLQEFQNSTNPRNADSDGDGLSDKDELTIYNTDPNNEDSDGDKYSDGAEVEAGTDPKDDKDYPGKTIKAKKEAEPFNMMFLLIAIIIIIIIVLIIGFLAMRGRKAKLAKVEDVKSPKEDVELEDKAMESEEDDEE